MTTTSLGVGINPRSWRNAVRSGANWPAMASVLCSNHASSAPVDAAVAAMAMVPVSRASTPQIVHTLNGSRPAQVEHISRPSSMRGSIRRRCPQASQSPTLSRIWQRHRSQYGRFAHTTATGGSCRIGCRVRGASGSSEDAARSTRGDPDAEAFGAAIDANRDGLGGCCPETPGTPHVAASAHDRSVSEVDCTGRSSPQRLHTCRRSGRFRQQSGHDGSAISEPLADRLDRPQSTHRSSRRRSSQTRQRRSPSAMAPDVTPDTAAAGARRTGCSNVVEPSRWSSAIKRSTTIGASRRSGSPARVSADRGGQDPPPLTFAVRPASTIAVTTSPDSAGSAARTAATTTSRSAAIAAADTAACHAHSTRCPGRPPERSDVAHRTPRTKDSGWQRHARGRGTIRAGLGRNGSTSPARVIGAVPVRRFLGAGPRRRVPTDRRPRSPTRRTTPSTSATTTAPGSA